MREIGGNDEGNGFLQVKRAITSLLTAKLTRSFTAASSLSLAVRVELWFLSCRLHVQVGIRGMPGHARSEPLEKASDEISTCKLIQTRGNPFIML